MIIETFGESVRGASHERSGVEGQDSFKIAYAGNVLILAVADGHGSKQAEFSKDGSQIAVDVFCRIMRKYIQKYRIDKVYDSEIKGKIASAADDVRTTFNLNEKHSPATDELISFLNREGQGKIAQTIVGEWQESVIKKHQKEGRSYDGESDNPAVFRKYGSTLLGLVVADDFVFAFQLGDGDIVRIDDTEIETLIEGEKILGVETHSIGKEDAWKNALSKVIRINKSDNLPYAYFLTTDGFANSYPSQDEYEKAIRDYFDAMKIHGAEAIRSNLAKWLKETSSMGCGDDTTMVVSYYADDKTEK